MQLRTTIITAVLVLQAVQCAERQNDGPFIGHNFSHQPRNRTKERERRLLARKAHSHDLAANLGQALAENEKAAKPGNEQGEKLGNTPADDAAQGEASWAGADSNAVTTGQEQDINATNSSADKLAAPTRLALTYSQPAEGREAGGEGFKGVPRDPFVWDGEPSWEWQYPRTLYFEPVAGLGNRLRALASAVVLAKEYGATLKVIWRFEAGCKDCGNPGFNSTWNDLFSEPNLQLADNFPGSNYSSMEELSFLRFANRDGNTPPIQPGQCYIHYPRTHHEMIEALDRHWMQIDGQETLCVKSDLWLTEAGEKEGKFFFRLLKPSPVVQSMIDDFKYQTEWEENHMVGIHVRRGDLTIYGKNSDHKQITSLIPIESYIEAMQKQKELAVGVKRVRFFLATDDAEAEAQIKDAFKPGYVMTYTKTHWSRLTVEGIQQALVDVMLLADCPVLIGTYYSSYSETAKMMGWPFYIQIGHALKKLSVETVFEKDDPEEETARRSLVDRNLQ